MAQLKFTGPLRHRLGSFLTINRIAIGVYARHLLGRKLAPDWDANTEIGVLFWRHQFTRAMKHPDIRAGRQIFESLQTFTDDIYEVDETAHSEPDGIWFTPKTCHTQTVLLYFHGGGYTFNGPISLRFAAMLAHHTGARLFMPKYRLTPEHPYPAQSEDALTAWRYLRERHAAQDLVVIGDSAGGHMSLTLLKTLRDQQEDQPALCIGLCPWTDIGARGDSMESNNRFDLVQGWMALQFGAWLNPQARQPRTALSPINWDFSDTAPLYLQAGGREMLRDMIIEFGEVQARNGASVVLDLWEDMPHDFQAYDSLHRSSAEALGRITQAVHSKSNTLAPLPGVTRQGSVAGKSDSLG